MNDQRERLLQALIGNGMEPSAAEKLADDVLGERAKLDVYATRKEARKFTVAKVRAKGRFHASDPS